MSDRPTADRDESAEPPADAAPPPRPQPFDAIIGRDDCAPLQRERVNRNKENES